jgi:hypothetical protein
MTLVLTEANVTDVLRQIIEEYGADHVYEPPGLVCVYVEQSAEGSKPSCIIAQILTRLGLPLDELADYEMQDVRKLHAAGLYEADPSLIDRLTALQFWQDSRFSWGVATRDAGFVLKGE